MQSLNSTGVKGQGQTQDAFAIVTENLSKTYNGNRGIDKLNLKISEGEVFGFLGPNGAGKTTTIRVLLNLISPTDGHALINGLDSRKDSVEIKKQIGYLPGEFALYPNLTGAQTVEYFANLRGGVDWNYVTELAKRLDLDLTKKFRQYSRGNKQKVGIIQALMHKPRLLILDEPTSGLDPLNQQEFYEMVDEVRREGRTVFFSSHIMSEVEKICDRVAIIREGKLVKVGHISELVGLKNHELELTFVGTAPAEEIKRIAGVTRLEVKPDGSNQVVHCVVRAESMDAILKVAAQYSIANMVSREPSLEESFLDYYRDPSQVASKN